ncbi:phage tail protein [Castellaniella sp.]|uniref:phage tail protein n=1 Tax=Castellaniella sp. TaxID=1955812 RepID=UPI002AFEA564|nr:phage tail protein [Castellaniella sp.]
MIDLSAGIPRGELERLMGMFQLSKEACRRAARRAVRKTAKWTEGQAARTMSAQLRIQQKIIRQRLRTYTKGSGLDQKVWLGLNSLAARRLGMPKRRSSGTQVGRHFFEGAFPINRYGGGVYRRTGKSRFPLELAKMEIDDVGAAALRAAAIKTEARLMEIMRQELRYEFSKVLKKAV